MNSLSDIKEKLKEQFVTKANEWVDITSSPSGLVNIVIVSDRLKDHTTEMRESKMKEVLPEQAINKLGFLNLYSVEEASLFGLKPDEAMNNFPRSWFDLANAAANEGGGYSPKTRKTHLPRTVAFYSFKGGVGRTTGLAHVAWMLAARGRKVLVVDLDLEAPGLHLLFNKMKPQPAHGLVDYLYERYHVPVNHHEIHVSNLFGEVSIENASGRLFVIPAGKVSLDYMAKVDDLRGAALSNSDLWDMFLGEVSEHLQPDIILVDSRTGINEWGAFSLLRVADEIILFLYPNDENIQGVKTILTALHQVDELSVELIYSKIPNNKSGKDLVKEAHAQLYDLASADNEWADPISIHYNPDIAVANYYPIDHLLQVYAQVTNLVDEEAEQNQLEHILSGTDRWSIIQSLDFTTVDAKDEKNDLSKVFQRTPDFDKFIDHTTSVVRGQKGTGKTALYWMMLKYEKNVQQLVKGGLDSVHCISAHGSFRTSPGKEEFRYLAEHLKNNRGSWEALWRAYILVRLYMEGLLPSLKKQQFRPIREMLRNVKRNQPNQSWTKIHTDTLLNLASDMDVSLLIKDLLFEINNQLREEGRTYWFLFDDLDEDIQEDSDYQNEALSGIFYLIQATDSQRLSHMKFKVFIREDIWDRLNFTNKSHFNGRDVVLKWTRVDFLRLAFRQARQSTEYLDLVDRYAPVADIDAASEEMLLDALQILWGIRRERNKKSKYVARWVYERLTDSTGTTFPRSLGLLLQAAKEHELAYENTHVSAPKDRLLRSKSLNEGLIEASRKRSQEIRQEYPELIPVFDHLPNMRDTCDEEDMVELFKTANISHFKTMEDFVHKLQSIGLISGEAKPKDKKLQYRFADLYVHGFGMKRGPKKF